MIFLDFDGTVVDVWPRYYQVFCAASSIDWITLPDYIETKQTLISDKRVAHFFGATLQEEYFAKKRVLLESSTYLQLDSLLLPPEELKAFFSRNECRFLSNRRNPSAFLGELESLGLSGLSNQAIILNPDEGPSKTEFLEKNFPNSPHIVVGDSEAEWKTAVLENVHVVLVRTGLRRPEDFPLEGKRTVLPSIRDFIAAYTEKGL